MVLERRLRDTIKRTVDVVVAAVGLVVLSPLLLAIAAALWLTQGRPILFRQLRPGRHGRPFRIAKFRTMRDPRPGEIAHRTDAVRMTRIGRILRSTSLDEVPELWNVLRGEMSLVGPRPLLMEYLASYSARQARRHDVRPGITSWAAVNGRHSLPFDERIELDVWYVEHRTTWLDLRIMGRTFVQVLARQDVSDTQDPTVVGFPLRDEPSLDPAERPPDGS